MAPGLAHQFPPVTGSHIVEEHKQVKVAAAVVLSSSDRAEHDHPHGIERRHYIFDNLGNPVPHDRPSQSPST